MPSLVHPDLPEGLVFPNQLRVSDSTNCLVRLGWLGVGCQLSASSLQTLSNMHMSCRHNCTVSVEECKPVPAVIRHFLSEDEHLLTCQHSCSSSFLSHFNTICLHRSNFLCIHKFCVCLMLPKLHEAETYTQSIHYII